MSTRSFLVSFCNNKQRVSEQGLQLARLDINSTDQTVSLSTLTIELPDSLTGNGVTGMCHHGEHRVLLLQRNPSTLVFLNQHMQVDQVVPLAGLKGVHTILSWQGELYVSVTNQDRIVKLDQSFNQHEIWSTGTQQDSIHLNSICVHEGALYASAFGPKRDQLWSSADQGCVFHVATSEPVLQPIWHPHSVFSHGGKLCCCHSSFQQVIAADEVLEKDLPGYTRGLFIDDELLICGTSTGRLVSHSTGLKISNRSGAGKTGGTCGVFIRFGNRGGVFTDLSHLGSEVFEVMPLQPLAT